MEFFFHIINSFYLITAQMAPWLLFGFFLAGLFSIFFTPQLIKKHLGHGSFKDILKASLFGVPLPLCSCGVIPVAAALKESKASKGAVAAFLISTPQTGVDSFIVTGSMLNWVFAILRPILALITGIVGGYWIEKSGTVEPSTPIQSPPCHQHEEAKTCCHAENTVHELVQDKKSFLSSIKHIFTYGFGKLMGDIAPSLLFGIILSGLISALLPANFGVDYLHNNYLAFTVMILIGLPMYICSTASVPLAATFLAQGISPGAVLVFLVVGPATNGAMLSTIWKILGTRSLIIYLTVVTGFAVLTGIALNLFPDMHILAETNLKCHDDLSLFDHFSACALLGLILYHLLKNKLRLFKARS